MLRKTTLYRYIFHEIWPSFLAILLIFTFIVIAGRMLNISEWIVNHGVHPLVVCRLILYLIPSIVLFALPAATLMAVMIAFLRFSSDNEILAMKSSGISLYQMVPPVILFSLLASFLALITGIVGVPSGNRAFRDLVFRIAHSKADLGIKERIFCRPFVGVTFYVNGFSPQERVMRDVFVVDRRDGAFSHTIVAKEGRVLLHPGSRMITLQFQKGTVFTMERGLKSFRTIGFNTYDLNIGLDDIMPNLSKRKKVAKEMGVGELLQEVQKNTLPRKAYHEIMKELAEKFSIPAAVFLMGLIGLSLGAQIRGKGRLLGVGISLTVFLIYYLIVAGMRSVAETGTVPPQLGMWAPVFFLLVAGAHLFFRAARERTIEVFERFPVRLGYWRRGAPEQSGKPGWRGPGRGNPSE